MRRVAMTLVLFLALSLGIGCSSNSKTVRTETVEYPAGQPERQTTTTTTTTESGSSGGILSGTVNVIGEIIAFPFRLVGGLLDIIF